MIPPDLTVTPEMHAEAVRQFKLELFWLNRELAVRSSDPMRICEMLAWFTTSYVLDEVRLKRMSILGLDGTETHKEPCQTDLRAGSDVILVLFELWALDHRSGGNLQVQLEWVMRRAEDRLVIAAGGEVEITEYPA